MKIRKNDTVLVITGKDKGKKGKVRFAYPDKGLVIVEGVNFVKKHSRENLDELKERVDKGELDAPAVDTGQRIVGVGPVDTVDQR